MPAPPYRHGSGCADDDSIINALYCVDFRFCNLQIAICIRSRDVALEIYKAATDGSRRLRYFIGVDSRGFLKAKQTLPDQEYIEFMRSYFRSGEGAQMSA